MVMSERSIGRSGIVVAAALILTGAVSAALARTTGFVTASAKAVTGVKVVNFQNGIYAQTLTADAIETWFDVTGATAGVNVPTTYKSALLLVRYWADASCSAQCAVRITVDGVPAEPAAGFYLVFAAPTNTSETYVSTRSLDQSLVVGPGNHVVQVQWGIPSGVYPGTTMTSYAWTLTVEKARIG